MCVCVCVREREGAKIFLGSFLFVLEKNVDRKIIRNIIMLF